MSKKLSEKEKLGCEIIKDLILVIDILEKVPCDTNIKAVKKLSEVSTKVKNLTLKFK